MSRELMASVLNFNQVLEQFVGYFQRAYGEIITQELMVKVYTSNKANKFISETKVRLLRPGTDDYFNVINSSTSFLFLKAEKVSFACSMLLHKWNIDVGIPYGISDDSYLNKVMIRILEKCDNFKTHTKDNPNFFDRFFYELDDKCVAFQKQTDNSFGDNIQTPEDFIDKPVIIANDDLNRFRHYDGRHLIDVDIETRLADIKVRKSLSGLGGDSLVLETYNEKILFPFAIGFDQTLLDSDKIGECHFKILLINEEEGSHFMDEYICFGHPSNFTST